MAQRIAQSHHERWMGKDILRAGRGGDSPEAQKCAIADFFDALTMTAPIAARDWWNSEGRPNAAGAGAISTSGDQRFSRFSLRADLRADGLRRVLTYLAFFSMEQTSRLDLVSHQSSNSFDA
jgi:hypothetical protein